MHHNDIVIGLQNLTGQKPKQKDFATALSVDIGIIGKRATRNSKYCLEDLIKIDNYFGSNFAYDYMQDYINANKIDSANIEVDYYPEVFGSCGAGAFVPSLYKERITIPRPQFYSANKTYSVINAIGDSMSPLIMNKDRLLVQHYDGEQIKDNGVYVFAHNDNIFIKRLVLNVNQLVIKSDNPIYDVIKLEKEEMNNVHIIGQVMSLMREF